MSGLRSRNKGARGEREIVDILHAHGWPRATRNFASGGTGNGDIANGPAGTAIEIKYQERLNVPAALDQLMADAHPTDLPLLVHRPSRHPWMVTLALDELLPLLKLRETWPITSLTLAW